MTESKLRWCQRDITLNTEFEIYGPLADKSLEDGLNDLKAEFRYLYNSTSGELNFISDEELIVHRTSGRIYHFKVMVPPEESN